jgi:ankyrin repeat protein
MDKVKKTEAQPGKVRFGDVNVKSNELSVGNPENMSKANAIALIQFKSPKKPSNRMFALPPDAKNLWYCHCCTAKNPSDLDKCRVCGRPESYALSGYHLPFHGENGKLYRPSQVINVMEDIHEMDSEKWTSLHSACANGNTAIVRQLLDYKAHIEAITDKGHRPIHLAVYSGSLECVYELIKRKAQLNVATFEEFTTPLHMACEKGYARIAQLLIQHGADIHARNIMQRTPLHCTAISGRSDIALLLLRSGVDIHAIDIHGWEACQIAELNDHRELQVGIGCFTIAFMYALTFF